MDNNNRGDELSPTLSIGLKVTVKIRGDSYDTLIRGWKPGVFILVDVPMSGADHIKVVPETSIFCRFLSTGSLVTCATVVISVLKQPLNIMVLEFPSRYDKIELRKSTRLTTSLPAVYYKLGRSEEKNVRFKATVRDLNLKGALLSSSIKLDVPSRIALSIKLSVSEKITNVVSIVQNLAKEKNENNEDFYLIGVEFKNLQGQDKSKLMLYIDAKKSS